MVWFAWRQYAHAQPDTHCKMKTYGVYGMCVCVCVKNVLLWKCAVGRNYFANCYFAKIFFLFSIHMSSATDILFISCSLFNIFIISWTLCTYVFFQCAILCFFLLCLMFGSKKDLHRNVLEVQKDRKVCASLCVLRGPKCNMCVPHGAPMRAADIWYTHLIFWYGKMNVF